jgi:hypothetical protein
MKKLLKNRRTQTISTNYSLCTSKCITPIDSNLYTLTEKKDSLNCQKNSFRFEEILIEYFELDKINKNFNKKVSKVLDKDKKIQLNKEKILTRLNRLKEAEKTVKNDSFINLEQLEEKLAEQEQKNKGETVQLKKLVLEYYKNFDYEKTKNQLHQRLVKKNEKILNLGKKLSRLRIKTKVYADKILILAKGRGKVQNMLKKLKNDIKALKLEKEKISIKSNEYFSLYLEPSSPKYVKSVGKDEKSSKKVEIEELAALQKKLKEKTDRNLLLRSNIQSLNLQLSKSSESLKIRTQSSTSLSTSIKSLHSNTSSLSSSLYHKQSILSSKESYLTLKESNLRTQFSIIYDTHK